jgi:HSP20 family protein
MPIIKWTPAGNMFNDMDQMFNDAWLPVMRQHFAPAVDVYEDKDNVVVEMPLANIDPEKVEITVENNVLTVSGKSEHKSEVDEKNYYRKEVRTGMFNRSIALPKSVNGEKAEATYDKGVLKVVVPKAEEAKPKTIKVTAK